MQVDILSEVNNMKIIIGEENRMAKKSSYDSDDLMSDINKLGSGVLKTFGRRKFRGRGRGWWNDPYKHALAQYGIETSPESQRRFEPKLSFANERGKEGIHIGGLNQYQHSRYRCPECGRGLHYAPKSGVYHCAVHGSVGKHLDRKIDTNTIEGCEWMIDDAIGRVKDIKESDYSPNEEELEEFGGKTMARSWFDYYTEKLKYIKAFHNMPTELEK